MNTIQNKVHLIGNVGKEPEIFTLTSGGKKAIFNLATHRIYNNADGEKVEETDWHRVVVFGKLADIVEKYVMKGKQLGIDGRLSTRSYDFKDGSKRYITEVICNELLLLGGPGGAN